MYTVSFECPDETVIEFQHTDTDEPVWMAGGLDLLDYHELPVGALADALTYTLSALRGSPDYYCLTYGESKYNRVLDFLTQLEHVSEEHRDSLVRVDW